MVVVGDLDGQDAAAGEVGGEEAGQGWDAVGVAEPVEDGVAEEEVDGGGRGGGGRGILFSFSLFLFLFFSVE